MQKQPNIEGYNIKSSFTSEYKIDKNQKQTIGKNKLIGIND